MTPPICTDHDCWVTVHHILLVPHYHERDPFGRTYDAYPVVGAEEASQPALLPEDA